MSNRPSRIRPLLAGLLGGSVLLGTLAGSASAAPTIGASTATTHDPLSFAGPRDLYAKASGTSKSPAQLADLVTLRVALKALEAGKVASTDMVELSKRADDLSACPCFGGADSVLAPGDRMSFDDALHAVMSNDAEMTRSVGEFVANAVLHGQRDSGDTVSESASLEAEFVTMMNDDTAGIVTGSTWKRPGGADEAGQVTTATDLTRIWEDGIRTVPGFIELLRTPGHTFNYWKKDGTKKWFTEFRSFNQYPGIDGIKDGSSAGCGSCLVMSATRANRRLTASVMGATSPAGAESDAAKMLADGFEQVFRPTRTGDSGTQASVTGGHDLSCYKTSCVTAVVTKEKTLKLIRWTVSPGTGKVTRGGSAEITGTGLGEPAVVQLDGNRILSAFRNTNGAVRLDGWYVDGAGVLTRTSTQTIATSGAATTAQNQVSLVRIGAAAAAIGFTKADGFEVRSYTVSSTGSPTLKSTSTSTAKVNELVLAGNHGQTITNPVRARLVASGFQADGMLYTVSFVVDPAKGTLTKKTDGTEAYLVLPVLSNMSITSSGEDRFTLSGADNGQLNMIFIGLDADGYMVEFGKFASPMGPATTTTVAGMGSGGSFGAAVISSANGGATDVSIIESPDRHESFVPEKYYRLARGTDAPATDLEVERIPDLSYGSYVIAQKDAATGNLKLVTWSIPLR